MVLLLVRVRFVIVFAGAENVTLLATQIVSEQPVLLEPQCDRKMTKSAVFT